MLPVLATAADVEDRRGGPLADSEVHRVAGLLDELTVHALSRVPALSAVEQPAPLAVRVVVSRAVADAMASRGDGVQSETVGPFTRRYADAAGGGVRLTDESIGDLFVALGLERPQQAARCVSIL